MLIDSHAHLEMPQFAGDRAAVLARAREAGVETILAIGSGAGPGSLACAIELAEEFDPLANGVTERGQRKAESGLAGSQQPAASSAFLYATIGIHPHEARLAEEKDFVELEQLANHPRVIAWGEVGLDYWYDHSPRPVQQQVFIRQMEQARAAKLPIIIHCRPSQNGADAWDDCLALLTQHWKPSGLGGVLHCFTGELRHAHAALDLGFVISFAGNVSFPKAQNIRDAARALPLDRMFIETDSPFLAPVPHRGKRNEPAFVAETARHIAQLRGSTAEEVGDATAANFRRFFAEKL